MHHLARGPPIVSFDETDVSVIGLPLLPNPADLEA